MQKENKDIDEKGRNGEINNDGEEEHI